MPNTNSLDGICAGFTYALGVDAPKHAAPVNPDLKAYIDKVFNGEKADRVVMFNPDAVAQWLYEKYPQFFTEAKNCTELVVPLRTVMPSVTPVCFGTMYTGAQPEVHGIRKYEKPVIQIDTLFDALIRAGKKPAIISHHKASSMSNIYLERAMDYFIAETLSEANAIAAELILRDEHDLIIVYNGNYDYAMHHNGPESAIALSEMRANVLTFSMLSELIRRNWKRHNTLVGFGMDHGCHEIDGDSGSHGLDMEEDLNIFHMFKGYPKEKE